MITESTQHRHTITQVLDSAFRTYSNVECAKQMIFVMLELAQLTVLGVTGYIAFRIAHRLLSEIITECHGEYFSLESALTLYTTEHTFLDRTLVDSRIQYAQNLTLSKSLKDCAQRLGIKDVSALRVRYIDPAARPYARRGLLTPATLFIPMAPNTGRTSDVREHTTEKTLKSRHLHIGKLYENHYLPAYHRNTAYCSEHLTQLLNQYHYAAHELRLVFSIVIVTSMYLQLLQTTHFQSNSSLDRLQAAIVAKIADALFPVLMTTDILSPSLTKLFRVSEPTPIFGSQHYSLYYLHLIKPTLTRYLNRSLHFEWMVARNVAKQWFDLVKSLLPMYAIVTAAMLPYKSLLLCCLLLELARFIREYFPAISETALGQLLIKYHIMQAGSERSHDVPDALVARLNRDEITKVCHDINIPQPNIVILRSDANVGPIVTGLNLPGAPVELIVSESTIDLLNMPFVLRHELQHIKHNHARYTNLFLEFYRCFAIVTVHACFAYSELSLWHAIVITGLIALSSHVLVDIFMLPFEASADCNAVLDRSNLAADIHDVRAVHASGSLFINQFLDRAHQLRDTTNSGRVVSLYNTSIFTPDGNARFDLAHPTMQNRQQIIDDALAVAESRVIMAN